MYLWFFLPFLALNFFSCSVYESEGSRIFREEGKQRIQTTGYTSLNEQEFFYLSGAPTHNCQNLSQAEVKQYLKTSMSYWNTEHAVYLYTQDESELPAYELKISTFQNRICWFNQDS